MSSPSVLNFGDGRGLALTTDGVGTKILVAEMAGRFDTIGIDCIAMNVNDLVCVGASNGIHSNGLTLARRVLFHEMGLVNCTTDPHL